MHIYIYIKSVYWLWLLLLLLRAPPRRPTFCAVSVDAVLYQRKLPKRCYLLWQ